MNHTLYPWEIVRSLDYETKHHIQTIHGYAIANVGFTWSSIHEDKECLANAHLIAAAPELLMSLRQIVDACEMPWMRHLLESASNNNDVETAIKAARKTIAKAEGMTE